MFPPPIGTNRNAKECTADTEYDDNKIMTICYSMLPSVHNISWASFQISTLSMIPGITSDEHQRGFSTAIRNIGAIMSNIFVFNSLWIMLGKEKCLSFSNNTLPTIVLVEIIKM